MEFQSEALEEALKEDDCTAGEKATEDAKIKEPGVTEQEEDKGSAESNGDSNSISTAEIEKEYDFANAGNSHTESDEDSWETVSDEARAPATEHDAIGPCRCERCHAASQAYTERIMRRSTRAVHVLPANVTQVSTTSGGKIFIVGTAHFSEASQKDVVETIEAVCPDVVLVELCQSRIGVLKYDEESLLREAQDVSLAKLRMAVREHGVVSGVIQLLLLSMSAHVTKQLGMAPGGEFRTAAREARKVPGCSIVLGDRPIQVTLGRAMAALSVWQKIKLGWHLVFSRDPISKEDVEKYKQKDMIAEMLAEMTGDFPELSRVFVEERDQYMATMLQHCVEVVESDTNRAPSSKRQSEELGADTYNREEGGQPVAEPAVVVAVVGIGHMNGIAENIGAVFDIDELLSVPPPSRTSRAFRLALKAAFVAALSWGVYRVSSWSGALSLVRSYIPV